MSNAVIVNGMAHLKGVTPRKDAGPEIAAQTRDVLEQIDAILDAAGTDRTKLVACTIWLADVATVGEVNAIYDAWVRPDHLPVRACVEARMVSLDYLIEIQVTAFT